MVAKSTKNINRFPDEDLHFYMQYKADLRIMLYWLSLKVSKILDVVFPLSSNLLRNRSSQHKIGY